MRKKIYDIKPPKVKKLEHELTSVLADKKIKKQKAMPASRQEKKVQKESQTRKLPWVWVSAISVVVFILSLYLFFTLPKADIEIWPKLEVMSFQEKVKAEDASKLVNGTSIPLYYFELEKSDSQDFPATGNASNEGYASGEITIYNKHQPSAPISLREGTRFISDSGSLFLSTQKVVIPGAQKSGGKIVPGSVKVKVRAAESGENYNIKPATFSVPGFKGTAYYFDVYATSEKAMTGGFSGEIKKVTENDVQNAKDDLSEKVISESEDELRKTYEAEYIILEEGLSSEVKFDESLAKTGQVKQNFNLKASVKTVAMTVKKSDLHEFIRNNIISKIPGSKVLLDGSLKEEYSFSDVDFTGKKMNVSLNISGQVYEAINKNNLTVAVGGQDENQINQSLTRILGDNIVRTKVDFWPFWVKKSPNSQKAIHIEIRFD